MLKIFFLPKCDALAPDLRQAGILVVPVFEILIKHGGSDICNLLLISPFDIYRHCFNLIVFLYQYCPQMTFSVSTLASRPPSPASLELYPVSLSICNCSLCFFSLPPSLSPSHSLRRIDTALIRHARRHMHRRTRTEPPAPFIIDSLLSALLSFSLSLSPPFAFTLARSLQRHLLISALGESREGREKPRDNDREALRQCESSEQGEWGFGGKRVKRRRRLEKDGDESQTGDRVIFKTVQITI